MPLRIGLSTIWPPESVWNASWHHVTNQENSAACWEAVPARNVRGGGGPDDIVERRAFGR